MAKMLRDTFFAKDKFDATFKQLKEREERMQHNQEIVCTTLHTTFHSIDDVERCNIENLKADMEKIREQERARFQSVLFCDDASLIDIEERHGRLLHEWTPIVEAFQGNVAFFRNQGITLKLDSKGKVWAEEKDLKRVATDAATIYWTDEDKQLYTKLGELCTLVSEIRGMQTVNYNYCLKWFLTDRHAPEYAHYGQKLGEIKGLSITPEKFHNMKRVSFGTQYGIFGVAAEDCSI